MVSYLFILDTLAGGRAVHLVRKIDLYNSVIESDSEISINALGLGYRTLLHSSFCYLIRDFLSYI